MFNCSPDFDCYYNRNIVIVTIKIRIAIIKYISLKEEIRDLADYFQKHCNIITTP